VSVSLPAPVALSILAMRRIQRTFCAFILSGFKRVSQKDAKLLFLESIESKTAGLSRSGLASLAVKDRFLLICKLSLILS
jgi:hypothetical protein